MSALDFAALLREERRHAREQRSFRPCAASALPPSSSATSDESYDYVVAALQQVTTVGWIMDVPRPCRPPITDQFLPAGLCVSEDVLSVSNAALLHLFFWDCALGYFSAGGGIGRYFVPSRITADDRDAPLRARGRRELG